MGNVALPRLAKIAGVEELKKVSSTKTSEKRSHYQLAISSLQLDEAVPATVKISSSTVFVILARYKV